MIKYYNYIDLMNDSCPIYNNPKTVQHTIMHNQKSPKPKSFNFKGRSTSLCPAQNTLTLRQCTLLHI